MENNFIDKCKLLGVYNDKEVYLYISSKYKSARLFYTPNYYYLPQWVEPDKLTFMQAVKIINYRLKRNNYDNFKPENINIDELIQDMRRDAPASAQADACKADEKELSETI